MTLVVTILSFQAFLKPFSFAHLVEKSFTGLVREITRETRGELWCALIRETMLARNEQWDILGLYFARREQL